MISSPASRLCSPQAIVSSSPTNPDFRLRNLPTLNREEIKERFGTTPSPGNIKSFQFVFRNFCAVGFCKGICLELSFPGFIF